MTSIRAAIQALLQREPRPEAPNPEYSYVIYWTKIARTWAPSRRAQALLAAERLIGKPGFEANAFERRYRDPEIDASAHSGESLLALRKVLRALDLAED